jgi:polyribonucleotide nucleotidyltransferase
MDNHRFSATLGAEEIVVETGKLAPQAGGAVTLCEGETMVLTTATMSQDIREGIDFFPLTVDFEERLYAAGRIPGSFFRREGRPTESAILTARLTDRPLRPLFPHDLRNDVQVIITALSQDEEHQFDLLAIISASAALTISDIPFNGPVGAVRVGHIDGELVVNPTVSQMEESILDLRLAGTAEALLMVEADGEEVSESTMVEALRQGHEAIQGVVRMQDDMRAAIGREKRAYTPFSVPVELPDLVRSHVGEALAAALYEADDKTERYDRLHHLRADAVEQLQESWEERGIKEAFSEVEKQIVRQRTLEEGLRVDGRAADEIRPLAAEVNLLPRVHGSGLFTRGLTQALSVLTLGTPRDEQTLDDLSPDETKRYLHHYNFLPFSTGETWPLRGPRRREIGHGALGARALLPVLPPEEEFPYTIRIVSEVLSSNGSTSMASVCGSTLALMDAGVPIKAPVAGIAMGLIMEGEQYRVLTDIQGLEDHLGDMDFKVAGTREGITALQMDIKVAGISYEIMAEALEQARKTRLQILDVIEGALPEPRGELSEYAPRLMITQVDPDKLGAIIGSGGKTVRAMQDEFDVRIDIEDDGTVFIAANNGPDANRALERIEQLTEEPELGRIYTGRVVRTTDFGAFVEILPGTDGMVHISQLSEEHVKSVESVVQVGDEIMVMITNISPDGKIRLSRQAVLEGWTLDEARAADRPGGGSSRGRSRRR